jgi:hypothetical protein
MRRLAFALASAALFAGGAAWSQATAPAAQIQYLSVKPDAILSSNLVGLDVYDRGNHSIGKIADIVLDRDSVSGYILSVGGFLGVAERYVAVQPSAVAISYDANAKSWRASANATKDELKSAPEFRYEGKWRS